MSADPGRSTALAEWRNEWRIILAAALGLGVSQLHFISLGFMIGPIERDLGWIRGQITAATLIFSLVVAIVSPFAGRVIDRRSERLIGIPAIACYCGFFMLLSQAGPSIHSWWAIWVGISCVSPFASIVFWTTVVARRFELQRGLALAVTLCGTAVGSALMPSLTHVLIDAYGWRGTFLRLGLVSGMVLLPLAFIALRPNGMTGAAAARTVDRVRLSWTQAFASPKFIKLVLASSVMSMTATTVAVHFVPLLLQRGIVAETAAAAAGLVGIGAIVGRVVMGTLLDRSRGPIIGALAFAFPILPCALLLGFLSPSAVSLLVGFLFGLSSGAETDVISYFTARYFGVRDYGAVFGAVFSFTSVSAGLGPWVAGMTYEATGSYTVVIAVILPLAALAALSLMTLGTFPAKQDSRKFEA